MIGSSRIKTVGVLGLGIIGSRVAENLRKANFDVFVWSQTARPVPGFVASPAEVAQLTSVIQIFVRDDAALAQVMERLVSSLRPDHIVMNHSTVSPEATKAAAEMCEVVGAGFLDAPFTGSKNAAEAGKLVYYIGGEPHLLDRVKPVLEASSVKTLHLGEVGEATVLKIATNLVSAVTVQALAEATAITQAAGIPAQRLLEALEPNANFSTLVGMKLPTFIRGDFEPHFSLKNMLKDIRYAKAIGKASGLVTPVLDDTIRIMAEAEAAGKGELDFSVLGDRVAASEPESNS